MPTSPTRHAAARMAAVQAPVIPIVARLIRSHPGTISLGQGIVSYGPPAESLEAVRRFGGTLEDHRYGPVEGEPALIDAIAAKLGRENGISAGTDTRIVVTAGGNMGFFNAVLAVADPGDEIVLLSPFYFNHDMAIVMAGCRTVAVPTDANHQIDLERVAAAITARTRAIVSVSPNNPTGAVYPAEALRALNRLCAERGVYHIHDEAYEYFTYGEAHYSPGREPGAAAHTISLYSLSKAFGFASWRIGYMAIPAQLFDAVNKIQDTNLICPATVSQRAALAALEVGRGYCAPFVAGLARVRALTRARLETLGALVNVPEPHGAFYFFLRIHTRLDPFALVERLVREYGVAAIPGSAFGSADACTLRVSYGALAPDTVTDGVDRLVTGLRAMVGNGG